MRQVNKVVLASMNVDKFREIETLLKGYPGIELVPIEGLIRNPEKLALVENHDSYVENAAAKARLANQGSHYPVLADDSGLEVLALDHAPGARSHRYAIPKAGQAQDQANVQKLLEQLKGKSDRSAKFIASLVLMVEGILVHATGELKGTITDSPRGTNGFGYDPVFIPEGSSKTLGEMTEAEKNSISHRARALQDLMNQVRARGIVLAKP